MANYDNSDYYIAYHGTSDIYAKEILDGNIDVSKGGGELGQGFYLGDKLYVAKAWAKQMHGEEIVVEFRTQEANFWNFDILSLDLKEAKYHREKIKNSSEIRTYKFNKDIIWSPIVGKSELDENQYKWESKKGEDFLNNGDVLRRKR